MEREFQRTRGRAPWLALEALLAAAAGACTSNPTTGVQIEVRNDSDNFQFHATALSQGSDLRSYTWQNSGTRATLDITIQGSAGSVHLEVRDAATASSTTRIYPPLSSRPRAPALPEAGGLR